MIKKEKIKTVFRFLSVSILAFSMVAGFVNDSLAKQGDFSIEGFVGLGIGPDDPDFDFGTAFSGGIGVGYEVIDKLQLRADISSPYKWNDDYQGVNMELRNIPLFLGGRYFLPISTNTKLFGELGLSVNFYEAEMQFLGLSVSESETKIGFVPGFGVEFMVTPTLGLGGNLRYHAIKKGLGDSFPDGETSFFSATGMIVYHF